MARLDTNQTTPKMPNVNIAGDFAASSLDIEPNSQPAMTESDAQHMREQRENVRQENLKATSRGQSSMGGEATRIVNPSSNANVNTDWPVDE